MPLGAPWRRVSWEWMRALEMLQMMISKGSFLARRDTFVVGCHLQ